MYLEQVNESIGSPSNLAALTREMDALARQHGHGINFLLLQWIATTFAQFTANQDDLAIGDARLALFSSDAPRDLTGLAGGSEGRILPFVNEGAQNIVLKHQDASSVAANRVICRTGADVTYAGSATGLIWYNPKASRWQQFI